VKDLIRGDFGVAGNSDASIIVPSLETVDGDEDKESPADITPIIKQAKTVKTRKLPQHDMSNILPTGKRIRKCPAVNNDADDVGIAGSKSKLLPKKEKKDTKDKELEKAARQNEVMVNLIFCPFIFDYFVAEAKSCRASGWARKDAAPKDS